MCRHYLEEQLTAFVIHATALFACLELRLQVAYSRLYSNMCSGKQAYFSLRCSLANAETVTHASPVSEFASNLNLTMGIVA